MTLNNRTGSDGRGTTANGMSSRRTPSAGPSVAVAMWKVAASVVTLLAALFYGIGRLLADGFYSSLNTTASAASVNTISIIEPAAILGALFALSVTVILILSDILQRWFSWTRRHSSTIVALVVAAALIALITWAVLYFNLAHHFKSSLKWAGWLLAIILLGSFLRPLLREWLTSFSDWLISKIDKSATEKVGIGAGAGPRAGEEGAAEEKARTSGEAGTGRVEAGSTVGAGVGVHLREAISSPWPRVTAVGAISLMIISLCIGAHYLGVNEASNAKKGIPVDMSIAGLDVSSISATRVRLQPVGSSQMVKSLFARDCLLQLGPGASNLLIYDVRKHETLSVPASEVIVVNLTAPKQCVP
jgi:hypothetical protein